MPEPVREYLAPHLSVVSPEDWAADFLVRRSWRERVVPGTENATRAFDLGTGGVIYKRIFNVPPKSSLLRECRGELEIAKGHRIARLIREEIKCLPIPSSPIKVSHQTGL